MSRFALRPAAALALAAAGCLLAGCAVEPAARPALSSADTIKSAQRLLTDRCLTRQGLTPPRPGEQGAASGAEEKRLVAALFGTGRTELSLTLPTGYDVRAHTDGCLAAAQRRLYGDQRRWFRTSTTVNNLKAIAAHEDRSLAAVRADHRPALTAYERLRNRAVERSTSLLGRHEKNTQREES